MVDAADHAAVLEANDRFYDAHERRDFDAMAASWRQSDEVVCVHPGWPILRGWTAVGDSWQRILSGPGRNQFILTNVEATVRGDIAWVTLDENLVADGRTGTVAATNIFSRVDGVWLLEAHHGSGVMG